MAVFVCILPVEMVVSSEGELLLVAGSVAVVMSPSVVVVTFAGSIMNGEIM